MDDTDSLAADNVYFRVGTDPFDPKERKYRTISIVIFLIDGIAVLAYLAWAIQAIVSGSNVVLPIVNLILSLVGLIVLGYGIYGSKNRGCSLLVYTIVFEFIPAVFITLAILICLLSFNNFKEEVQKQIKEMELHIDVGAAIAFILIYYFILDAYHIFAGIMINRYRRICKQRDWEF